MTVQNFKAQSVAVVVEISERSNCVKLPDTDSIDDLLPIPDGTGTPSAQTTPIILAKDYLMTGDDDVEFYHLVYAYAPQNFS